VFSALKITLFWYVTPCSFIGVYNNLPNYITRRHVPIDRNLDINRPKNPKFRILLQPCLFQVSKGQHWRYSGMWRRAVFFGVYNNLPNYITRCHVPIDRNLGINRPKDPKFRIFLQPCLFQASKGQHWSVSVKWQYLWQMGHKMFTQNLHYFNSKT
jgi:hypothetical protein